MEETLYTDLIAKYLSGNIAVAERETLYAWIESDAANRQFFDQMVQLWGMSSDSPAENYETDTQAAWSKLEGRLFEKAPEIPVVAFEPSNKIRILSIKRGWIAAAAVILLLISVSIWLYQNPISAEQQQMVYQTGAQERRSIELPDGSTIWLNENTRLSFNEKFAPRVVELEGEAFFEVQHQNGEPFTIQSGGAETQVLGTSFNVRAYPSEAKVEVTVETGKVALSDKDDATKKVLLVPGKSGVFDKQTQEVAEVAQAITNADAWKTQRLDFRNMNTKTIVTALERYFDVNIQVENEEIYNCDLSMTQPLDAPKLEIIFEQMTFAWGVQIEKQDSTYIIKGQGCK